MPLLNDAKTCYVGTTPISKIYAGTQQVWPKGPPPPFSNFKLFYGRYENEYDESIDKKDRSMYAGWEVPELPKTCARASAYEIDYSDTQISNGDNPPGSDPRPLPNLWRTFGVVNVLSFMSNNDKYKNLMAIRIGELPVYNCYCISYKIRYTNNGVVTTSDESFFWNGYFHGSDYNSFNEYPTLTLAGQETSCYYGL